MHHVQAQISEAVIKRHAAKITRQISDTRYPLKFRFSSDRTKGSWFVVTHDAGKASWRKVGSYPGITAKVLIERLPAMLADSVASNDSNMAVGRFESVNEVLNWYLDRACSARYLSKTRRSAISSIIKRHLVPALGDFSIQDLTHEQVDFCLIRPVQQKYSLAYTRQIFDILRLAFKQAQKLRNIQYNPIAGFKFSDFIDASIKPREGRVRQNQLPMLFEKLQSATHEQRILCLFMLLHGTRIGETKALRWDYIDWQDRSLSIPEELTKTREGHRIPLTDIAVAALKRYRAHQEYNGYKGLFLFPNGRGKPISATIASEMVRGLSNQEWSAHDLRKLARTCWADLGVDYMVSERLLNHKLSKLDQAYIHTYVETQKRQALEKYHQWLRNVGLNPLVTG